MITRRTRLELRTSPNAKLASKPLSTLLELWINFASKVEENLLPSLESQSIILWQLVYNWAPDDDPEAEMTPQYQPLISGNVSIIDSDTLWVKKSCSLRFEFNFGGIMVYKKSNTIEVGDKLILEITLAELNH